MSCLRPNLLGRQSFSVRNMTAGSNDTNFMYVAASAGIDAKPTWRLLRDWNAIWCSPHTYEPWRVQQHPEPNDRVWR